MDSIAGQVKLLKGKFSRFESNSQDGFCDEEQTGSKCGGDAGKVAFQNTREYAQNLYLGMMFLASWTSSEISRARLSNLLDTRFTVDLRLIICDGLFRLGVQMEIQRMQWLHWTYRS